MNLADELLAFEGADDLSEEEEEEEEESFHFDENDSETSSSDNDESFTEESSDEARIKRRKSSALKKARPKVADDSSELPTSSENDKTMAGAVLKFLQDRASTQQPKIKRKRVNRTQAECITEQEAAARIAEVEAAAHKKKLDAIERKKKSDEKKRTKAEDRVKAAHERFLKAKDALEETNSSIKQSQKRGLKTANKAITFCYICDNELPVTKNKWLSCDDCGVWCCDDCMPKKRSGVTNDPFFCNDCIRS